MSVYRLNVICIRTLGLINYEKTKSGSCVVFTCTDTLSLLLVFLPKLFTLARRQNKSGILVIDVDFPTTINYALKEKSIKKFN